jgi:phage terminase small subunit
LSEDGLTVVASNGTVCPSPYVKILKEAEATMYRLLVQFGLTPKARNTVKQQEKKPVIESKWADFTRD